MGDRKCAKSQQIVDTLCNKIDTMLADFKQFVLSRRASSATFAFWDDFIQLVSLLKDLIHADWEGDWELHVSMVQTIIPLFAAFGKINYLRWVSIYQEDMRKFPETAEAGKFVAHRVCSLLFKYDLTSSWLFDNSGLMTKRYTEKVHWQRNSISHSLPMIMFPD